MAQEKNYTIKVNLAALSGAFVKDFTSSRTGVTKKCVVIPVDDNPSMFAGEKGIYLNIAAFANENPRFDDTHMLKPNVPKEVREQMSDEERRAMPILGNMRPMHQEMPSQGAPISDENIDQPQDDLPF